MTGTNSIEDRPPSPADQLQALMPKLKRQAFGLTGSLHLAEDLVQDTCVRALARLDQWKGVGRFDGWVATIMERIWSNRRRQQRQRQEQELPDPDLVPTPGFEAQVEALLTLDDMRRAAGVSDEDFFLVTRIHAYDYTYRDLAEIFGVPHGTMLSKVSRAKALLRKVVRGAIVKADAPKDDDHGGAG
jgi:RNA polymerase sigma-70 factor (ECF subfamily)